MALAGELAKYIGNELVNTGSKALAKAGATSTLSSLVPKVATDVATKTALGGILPSAAKSASDSMMTLYRGLTQKYDPKYPVAKLDTSGYESWTDNPELARQYGDYVYSIDVPKTDIKDSYLDENPNSPTYGDRNPIYGIDKKAGLNGISGKEYLLEVGSDYQKGLTYNEVPGEVEMAIKNSGVGSDAVKRAEGYLGGTMLDKSGKPITFYHSTPNEFSKFDDARLGENTGYDNTALGHFVTTDKDFSKRFIDIDKTGKTGRTMELRAKIQKPITHPYMAGQKYDEKELDKIVEDYLIATNNQESLQALREYAKEDGSTIYDEYMDMTFGADSPFEYAADDRKALLDNGYDAVEIVEGPKSGLVEGSNDDSIVSSYAVLNGDNLVPVRHIPVQQDNYVPLYHQTSANSLADFSLDKRKAIGADYGMPEGIFLKDTNADIGLPGKNQLRLDAKMDNPATFENREALAKYMGERNPKYTALVNELDEINDTYDDYLMDYMAERGMNPEDYLDFDTAMNSVDKYIEDRAKEARDMISTQLKKDGYDGAIINSDTGSNGRSVKSYVVMGKDQLRDSSVPVKFAKKSSGKPTSNPDIYNNVHNIPVNKSVMDKVAKYLKSPTDAKYAKLVDKAKGYKSLDRFEKMNNPIKGSEIWGEKPTSVFQRDSRAVRVNMFPNEAVKGTGITKQYLLNLFKDAYDQGITDIVPSYGSYTKEGASFMDHLAEQGWVKDTGKNGWKSYEISPKIAEWEKTSPLADIYNDAHNIQQSIMELSPEQQEFFKDSVVRDKDGNLMPVFHTTNTNKRIDIFNADNGMVWVTPNKMYSTGFAGNGYNPDRTYELYANIKNPVYVGNIDPAINDETIEKLSAYTGVDEETLLAIAEKYDARNIWKITNSKDFKELMQAKGYDGIEAREGGGQVSFAAFSPEQVKRAGNLKPTSNPDIRYSKDTGRSLVEMHERLKAMNKSRELDPNVKRIGNSAVAEVDTKTLPAGYEKVKKYLETSPNDVLYNALGVNLDDVDVSEWGDIIKNWIEEQGYEADKNVVNNLTKVREIVAEQLAEELSLDGSPYAKFVQTRNALAKDNPGKGVSVKDHTISANNDQIYQTDAGKLDREYSERLGIGRSHTPMSDNAVAGDAQGVYFAGGIGVKPELAQGETGVSTIAHERLHSWQNARRGQWDDRVIDAIDDLRGELKDFYHTKDQIKKYRKSGESLEYYANKDEQEARMLQSYLDNEGYTNTWKKNVADGTEWGDEVKPAFDKFYKKLRSLSKAGVALPAIAVLFGLNTNTGKKLDKKS